jgi:hypothetical protein
MNWRNFSVIRCDFEYGTYKGCYLEVVLGLLGFTIGFEFTGARARAAWQADMDQKIAAATEAVRAIARGYQIELPDEEDDEDKETDE